MKNFVFKKVSEIMEKSPLVLSSKDKVSKFLGLLEDGVESVLVKYKNRIGLVAAGDLLDVKHPERTCLGEVARRLPTLNTSNTVLEVVSHMVTNRVELLPIVRNNVIIGQISCTTIMSNMLVFGNLENTLCGEVVNRKFVSISSHDKVSTVRSLMRKRKVSHAIVLDNEGSLIGTISARDIVLSFIKPEESMTRGEYCGESKRVWNMSVKCLLDLNPIISTRWNSIKNLVKSFRKLGKSICVIVEERLIGTITPLDVITLLLKFKTETTVPVSTLGLPQCGDFLDIVNIQDKIIRVLKRGIMFIEDIEEVIVDVKRRRQSGDRFLYQIIARVYSPTKMFVASAEGWYLGEAIDILCKKMDRVLRRSKRRKPKRRNV